MPINPQILFVFLKIMLRFEFFNIKNHSVWFLRYFCVIFQDTMDHINQESCKSAQLPHKSLLIYRTDEVLHDVGDL